jgi:hypothetical protein
MKRFSAISGADYVMMFSFTGSDPVFSGVCACTEL